MLSNQFIRQLFCSSVFTRAMVLLALLGCLMPITKDAYAQAPTITSVTSSTPDGIYNTGDTISVTVNFSEPVRLGWSGMFRPNFLLRINLDSSGIAEIGSIEWADSATGTYTVESGHNSTNLDSVSVELNSPCWLRDSDGNDAVLSIPSKQSLADKKNILVNTIPPLNASPTDIHLSGASVAENQPSGTSVGTFSATDPDSSSHTYHLTYNIFSSSGNNYFTIDGNTLKTSSAFNYESKTSYSIYVRCEDGEGGARGEAFTINVTNVNESPTSLALSSASVKEGESIGTTVGTFSTQGDPDTGDTHTYSLVSGTGSTDNSSFRVQGNALNTAKVFDYDTEAKHTYGIRVQTSDGKGGTFAKTFAISIQDVNEAPVGISLSSTALDENSEAGTQIGKFSAEDSGGTHSFSLVSGTGDTDNASFKIVKDSGGQFFLHSDALFDYESKNSYSIRVQVTDAGGESLQKKFEILVNDVNEPPLISDIEDQISDEDSSVGPISFTLSDPDPSDVLTLTCETDKPDLLPVENVIFGGSGTERTLTLVPVENAYGKVMVTLTVSDGELSQSTNLELSIQSVNDPPADIQLCNLEVDEMLNIGTVIGVFSVFDPDSEDQYHAYSLSGDKLKPKNGIFAIEGNTLKTGSIFAYDKENPADNFQNVTIWADDGNGGVTEWQFVIEITLPKYEPVAEFSGSDSDTAEITLNIGAMNRGQFWLTEDMAHGALRISFDGDMSVMPYFGKAGLQLGERPEAVNGQISGTLRDDSFSTLMLSFENPVSSVTAILADFGGDTSLIAYDADGNILKTLDVRGDDPEAHTIEDVGLIWKAAVIGSSAWIGDISYQGEIIPGDVNMDGYMDMRDALAVLQVLCGMSETQAYKESDISGNSRLGMEDIIRSLWQISEQESVAADR